MSNKNTQLHYTIFVYKLYAMVLDLGWKWPFFILLGLHDDSIQIIKSGTRSLLLPFLAMVIGASISHHPGDHETLFNL